MFQNALDSNYTAYHPAEVDPASPSAAPATNFKLLKRSNQNRNHASNSQTVDTKVNEQSVEERERQYEQARARIFEGLFVHFTIHYFCFFFKVNAIVCFDQRLCRLHPSPRRRRILQRRKPHLFQCKVRLN
jgi:hypothetical protein